MPNIDDEKPDSPDSIDNIDSLGVTEAPGDSDSYQHDLYNDIDREEPKVVLPIVLFITTLFTTIIAGAFYEGVNLFDGVLSGDFTVFFGNFHLGLPFSLALLSILGIHEFGHFFAAKKHGVRTTYPHFIPGPPLPPMIGTFGAVIRVKSPIRTKKALIDIGAAGPLAGFVAALFITIGGFMLSSVVLINPDGAEHLGLGNSLLLKAIEYFTVGTIPEGFDLALHPIAFAGWIGLFITALNLMPIGQLDGGHMLYALLGRYHKKVSMAIAASLIVLGSVTWLGWAVWGVIVFFIGTGHPPVENESEELTKNSKIVCLLSVIVFILTLIPTPFYIIGL